MQTTAAMKEPLAGEKSNPSPNSTAIPERIVTNSIMFMFSISFGYPIPWYFLRQPCNIKCMAKPSPTHSGKPVLTELGDVVRSSRLKLGLSQEALAVDAELDRSYVGGIERGEHNLTLINLQKIANALGTKPSVLLKAAGN